MSDDKGHRFDFDRDKCMRCGMTAEEALRYFAALYEIERLAREQKLDTEGRRQLRQQRAKPVADSLRQWLI